MSTKWLLPNHPSARLLKKTCVRAQWRVHVHAVSDMLPYSFDLSVHPKKTPLSFPRQSWWWLGLKIMQNYYKTYFTMKKSFPATMVTSPAPKRTHRHRRTSNIHMMLPWRWQLISLSDTPVWLYVIVSVKGKTPIICNYPQKNIKKEESWWKSGGSGGIMCVSVWVCWTV